MLQKTKRRIIASEEPEFNRISQVLDRKSLKPHVLKLSQIDNFKATGSIITQWFFIILALWLALGTLYHFTGQVNLLKGFSQLTTGQFVLVVMAYLSAGLIIATRQHALGIITHDATHYRLYSNHAANEIISNLFCAFPNGISTSLYRFQHLIHHRFPNSDHDPYWVAMLSDRDWNWPKTRIEATQLILGDLIGLKLKSWVKIISNWSPWPRLFDFKISPSNITRQERFLFLGFWLFVASMLTLSNNWLNFVLLWLIPQLTVLNVFIRLRSVAEHLVLPNENELNQSRHVDGTLLERLTIAPLNINIHIAHHMFPSVPQYNLPKLHQILLKNDDYRTKAKVFPNYLSLKNGVMSELIIPG